MALIDSTGEKVRFSNTGTKFTGEKNSNLYNRVWSGNSLNLIFQKNHLLPIDIDPQNIIARGANFDWQENYNILPVVEYNEYFIQEQVIGLQELGKGSVSTWEILRINDNLPSVKTLAHESEMTVLEVVGDQHPQRGLVLNVFYGVRIIGQSGGFSPTGLAGRNVSLTYRYRLPGKDYKALVKDAKYAGGVEANVPLDNDRR